MKIYNQDKTIELAESDINYELGHLVEDRLFIAHHDEIVGKTVEEVKDELVAQGKECEQYSEGKWHVILATYANGGKDVKEIEAVAAKDAYDEYEDIQVYITYTEQVLEERRLNSLRYERASLLSAFDKWEKAVMRGREEDDKTVMQWYRDLLDLKESTFTVVPERIKYYL